MKTPLISIIILNYNGAKWIQRCIESICKQTIYERLEIIVADNQSTDESDLLAEKLLKDIPNGKFIQNGGNYGYCQGNNLGAEPAVGEWFFFMNNDAWMEPDCLERLITEVTEQKAVAATPYVMDYDSDHFQSMGAGGFDIFGFPTCRKQFNQSTQVLMPEGCSYLIRADIFKKLGKFDPVFFMYADELDLSWRVWNSGNICISAYSAKIHHRGAAQVNSAGSEKILELRTSDTKRFYANRNNLFVLLKNTGILFFPIILLQIFWLIPEGIAGCCMLKRASFFKNTVWNVFKDCWKRRSYIRTERLKIRQFKTRSDFWFLKKFLRFRLNRWDEFLKIRKLGLPKVTPKK